MNDQTRVTRKFLLRICGFFTVDKAVHRPTILFEKPFGAKSQPGKKVCRPGVGTQEYRPTLLMSEKATITH